MLYTNLDGKEKTDASSISNEVSHSKDNETNYCNSDNKLKNERKDIDCKIYYLILR